MTTLVYLFLCVLGGTAIAWFLSRTLAQVRDLLGWDRADQLCELRGELEESRRDTLAALARISDIRLCVGEELERARDRSGAVVVLDRAAEIDRWARIHKMTEIL